MWTSPILSGLSTLRTRVFTAATQTVMISFSLCARCSSILRDVLIGELLNFFFGLLILVFGEAAWL